MVPGNEIPLHHPIRELFLTLTNRGLRESEVSDEEIHLYLSNLLVEFVHMENVYKVRDGSGQRVEYLMDMLGYAEEAGSVERSDIHKHVGDFTLFVLGLYPESLSRGRRSISQSHYAAQGRRSYQILFELQNYRSSRMVFQKLSEEFEGCVQALRWVRSYINDPFYQYMFREFDIT